ncbi:MAG: hypothetical protein OER82_01550 [Nitrosopumilus sp.]|nr:hypothetical protein [Nitrosopumilus sp.]
MKNSTLHDSFSKLMKSSISSLNRTLSQDAKTLLPRVDSFTFYRFIKNTFTITELREYEDFKNIINSDKKLNKNFEIIIGTYESRASLSTIEVVEKLLFSYIEKNSFKFNKIEIDKLYLELENFLLSPKLKLTLEIPINGLDYVKTTDLVLEKNLKIVEIQGVYGTDSNVSNNIPKHKLLFDIYSPKVTKNSKKFKNDIFIKKQNKKPELF